MLVVAALGVNFGLLPWPLSAATGVAIVLPLFLAGAPLVVWVAAYSLTGFAAGLLLPHASTDCGRVRVGAPPAAAPPTGIQTATPPGGESVGVETHELSTRVYAREAIDTGGETGYSPARRFDRQGGVL
jgi:hypothetical protein